MPTPTHDELTAWMKLALIEADKAADAGEVPVGCVIIGPNGEVLATGQNRRERDEDPTGHAEIVAMREAARVTDSWRLVGCTLLVTLEPCAMCAGAIVNARVPRVVFGATDPKAGACGSVLDITADDRLNHRPQVIGGIEQEACAEVLRAFFREQRRLGKK
jgi:tRNA(adenine34) deaminase